MSHKTFDDQDPQLLADLEKAKALSLETLALEQFKQKRRLAAAGITSSTAFVQSTSSNNGTTATTTTTVNEVALREYKQQLERRLGRPLSGGSVDTWKQNSSISVSGTGVARRASEIKPPSAKDVPDLMDFNAPSPTKPKDPQSEAHDNFKQLVEDMHK